MEAYCFKCKEKREIAQAQPGFTSRGAAMTNGVCAVCGTKLFRMGLTPAHEGLEKPDVIVTKSAAKKPAGTKKTKTARKPVTTRSSNGKKVKSGNGKPLVIVESPAKARTIGKFLGDGYQVLASVGHVRDLLKSQLSVDVDNDFAPKYRVPNEKKELVAEITATAERSKKIYLATDPDREGESIAWHVMDSAQIEPEKVERVVFHEITKEAIDAAFARTREIDMDLVDAQQARRILDRLVGYGVSPILWAKVKGRLSAGRVQSVALRLIVEREREIQAFVPVEYWKISALFEADDTKKQYKARLIKVNKADPNLTDEATTLALLKKLEKASYQLDSIDRSTKSIRPGAPFITNTLQQEASTRLGFLTKKTMAVAQQLYEGIDLGGGEETGLITYMRTDSVHVSAQSVQEAREYIANKYGDSYVPEKPPVYRTRAASAQEAHEAIRPTSVKRTPESVKNHLTADQYRLYKLIWQRFIASQMTPALIETITADIAGNIEKDTCLFRATGNKTIFPGYRAVYSAIRGEDEKEDEDQTELPLESLVIGQMQRLLELNPSQHFTEPPPRFTEASLIQVLEENKIGRPSTYSAIITTIQVRGYVTRESKRLVPTEIGFLVNDLVVEYFPSIVDIEFTSSMEDKLDEIAQGETPWVEVIRDFYAPFKESLEHAKDNMPKTQVKPETIGRACPECGGDLVLRTGRFGRFISCSTFPKCKYTEPWLEKIGVTCPECHQGDVVEKRSKRGRLFYGCSRYPECNYVSWDKPLARACPKCGGKLTTKNDKQAYCSDCHSRFELEEGILQQ